MVVDMSSKDRREPQKFFSIGYVAEALSVSTRTVRRWTASKALPAHRLGRLVRISQADLAAFLATHRD
jgi:excisionase family DNA binding protein